jgi:AcrR family transcriptional regulator
MSTTSLRDRKKEQTRLVLFWAAVELFKEKGYDHTSVDDIVERANYSKSTFFRYFASKEAVVFGDLPDRLSTMRARLDAAAAESGWWVGARRVLTSDVLDLVAFAPEFKAECVELWFSVPALHLRYAQSVIDTEEVLAQFLVDVWGRGSENLTACHVVATAMVGVGRAAMRTHGTDGRAVLEALNRGFDLLASETGNGGASFHLAAVTRLPR